MGWKFWIISIVGILVMSFCMAVLTAAIPKMLGKAAAEVQAAYEKEKKEAAK